MSGGWFLFWVILLSHASGGLLMAAFLASTLEKKTRARAREAITYTQVQYIATALRVGGVELGMRVADLFREEVQPLDEDEHALYLAALAQDQERVVEATGVLFERARLT